MTVNLDRRGIYIDDRKHKTKNKSVAILAHVVPGLVAT